VRGKGRLKKRWIDGIESVMRIVGVCEREVEDRDLYRRRTKDKSGRHHISGREGEEDIVKTIHTTFHSESNMNVNILLSTNKSAAYVPVSTSR